MTGVQQSGGVLLVTAAVFCLFEGRRCGRAYPSMAALLLGCALLCVNLPAQAIGAFLAAICGLLHVAVR